MPLVVSDRSGIPSVVKKPAASVIAFVRMRGQSSGAFVSMIYPLAAKVFHDDPP